MKKTAFATSLWLLLLTLYCISPSGLNAQTEPAQLSQSAGDLGIFCDGVKINRIDRELSFNWTNETIDGKAVLPVEIVKPNAKSLTLSTKGNWEFRSIKIDGKNAAFSQDSSTITLFFPAETKEGQKMKIDIAYRVIKPRAGAYFINPRGEIPGQPKQIWAQGEPEDNSFWMPIPIKEMNGCFRKMPGSLTLFVENKYKTVSNGNLVKSKKLKGGMRSDTWEFDQSHAPYLFTFIIGEFDIVKDNSGRIPVEFYIQKGYKDYAHDIFPQTVELLDFFSEKFGPYPWPNYKQVILEDYTFGAMENTTAVTFHKSFQGTGRELEGNMRNFAVVAHEMMHHWFGDITTAAGWDHFVLNEGFATYGEWIAIKEFFGEEAAFNWFKVGRDQYFDQCYGKHDAHPLIDSKRAENPIAMFDRHSYKKGGWVLRQINQMTGDSLFFASCQLYLTANYYGYATWSDLENSFESTCRQDLSWYFDQWGHQIGHPIIEVYTAVMGDNLVIGLEQIQRKKYGWEEFYLESIPTITKYKNGKVENGFLHIGNVEFQTVVIPLEDSLVFFAIDPDKTALVDWRWNMSLSEYENLLWECESFPSRSDALDSLTAHKVKVKNYKKICDRIMDDGSPILAARGLEQIGMDSFFTENMAAMYLGDGLDAKIRKAALSKLGGKEWQTTFVSLCEDKNLEIQALALGKLLTVDTTKAIQIATAKWEITLKGKPPIHERYITKALLDILIHSEEVNYKMCLKSVCENGGPYCWLDLEGTGEKPGPMIKWLSVREHNEREEFLNYLRLFNKRFELTLKHFGPKVPVANSGK